MLSFDPSGLSGGSQCVDFLKEKNIIISQKIGARLLALKNNNIELTLAALEDIVPNSEKEKFILSPFILSPDYSNNPDKIKHMASTILTEEPFNVILEDGIIKIASFYESDLNPGRSLVKSNPQKDLVFSPNKISPNNLISDRRYIEELTFSYLDSTDDKISAESLRKLVRIAIMSEQDPTGILIDSIRRSNPAFLLQTSEIISELIDKDFGDALEKIFSADSEIEALLFYNKITPGDSFRNRILSAIIPGIITKFNSLRIILENPKKSVQIYEHNQDQLAYLLKQIIFIAENINSLDLKYFRNFLKNLPDKNESMEILKDLYTETLNLRDKVYILWFISAGPILSEKFKLFLAQESFGIIMKQIKAPAWLEMVKTVAIHGGDYSIDLFLRHYHELYKNFVPEIIYFLIDIISEPSKGFFSKAKLQELAQEIIKNEFRRGEDTVLRKIFYSNLQKIADLPDAKEYINDRNIIINAAYWVFTADKTGGVSDIPKQLNALIPDAASRFREMIKNYPSEKGEDLLEFLTEITLITSNSSVRADSASFLKRYGTTHPYLKEKSLEMLTKILARTEKDSESSLKLFQEAQNINFSNQHTKINIYFNLLETGSDSQNFQVGEIIIDMLENGSSEEREYILEKLTDVYQTGKTFPLTQKLLTNILKLNALKITTPGISVQMKLEDGESKFSQVYARQQWTWTNIGQSLFIAQAIITNYLSNEKEKETAWEIIRYLFRHWTNRNNNLMLNDKLFYTTANYLSEQQNLYSEEIASFIYQKVKKSENLQDPESVDLKKYLIKAIGNIKLKQRTILIEIAHIIAESIINKNSNTASDIEYIKKILEITDDIPKEKSAKLKKWLTANQ